MLQSPCTRCQPVLHAFLLDTPSQTVTAMAHTFLKLCLHHHLTQPPAALSLQLSNVITGDSAPWEALRQLRNLRELMLHNFRDAQKGPRPGRNSTPRSPGYLWRDMEQLRLLSVTGTMHRDLLERSSVAYAVGGRSTGACRVV